jgi:hypothetical protein
LYFCPICAIRWFMEQRPDGETSVLQDPEACPCGLIAEDGV